MRARTVTSAGRWLSGVMARISWPAAITVALLSRPFSRCTEFGREARPSPAILELFLRAGRRRCRQRTRPCDTSQRHGGPRVITFGDGLQTTFAPGALLAPDFG